jgi:hypothetical protein
MPLDRDATRQLIQRRFLWNSLYLSPITAGMPLPRMQQLLHKSLLVGENQQAFRIRIQSTNRIHVLRQTKLAQRPIGGTIQRELRKHSIGFVEC